ncbi:substrate-binding domain-containing protein [Sinanaerobacter chloroacetimidivorans]|jgi:ribose transport system substrate-binding protein|uniref:Substrate-binding domain-containing protein n=1 Tax=Sinanaerobacter chloroacetimidivorans TaxID=2818044 RepID=A0A8J8B4E3_9FIRM|nr:substrate-binding domain-containing protein [Sinanaerobacter chloroacetimidivorans]MBR0599260.1 substrate-binding domain-containing protein [Sinanaerobacter chloroacetimidivorans]
MKRKGTKLIALALVVLLMSMTLLAGCGSSKTDESNGQGDVSNDLPTVGISTGSSGTSWRNIMIDALDEVGKEYLDAGKIANYKIVNNVNNGDATEQANIIRDFISEGVDIILVNPNSPDALNGVIKEAQDAGILVLAFDATVTAPDVVNVTLDHYVWNVKNVDFICKTVGKGTVIQVYGLDGHPANNERIKATEDVLKKYPDIKMIASTSGGWDQTKAKEVTTQIIGSGQQIDGAITQDSMGFGVLSAFQDAGKLPKVMFGDPGTAFFKEWKKLRDAGADFKACAQPNPPGIGGTGFRIALNLYNGMEFKDDVLKDGTYYYEVSSFYTDENFDEAWEMLKDKPDDYLLSEIMPQDKVDELFK